MCVFPCRAGLLCMKRESRRAGRVMVLIGVTPEPLNSRLGSAEAWIDGCLLLVQPKVGTRNGAGSGLNNCHGHKTGHPDLDSFTTKYLCLTCVAPSLLPPQRNNPTLLSWAPSQKPSGVFSSPGSTLSRSSFFPLSSCLRSITRCLYSLDAMRNS